jgi:hypothetical protein
VEGEFRPGASWAESGSAKYINAPPRARSVFARSGLLVVRRLLFKPQLWPLCAWAQVFRVFLSVLGRLNMADPVFSLRGTFSRILTPL